MTFQDAITTARSELGDTYDGAYSYSNEDMLRYAIEGVREAWTNRPSLKYNETTGALYDETDVFPTLATTATDIPLPASTQHAIQYYIVYGCLSRDVTDENNVNVGMIAKERFNQIVMR
jgi:hypothetical protein